MIDYLKDDCIDYCDFIDLIQYELDKHIYYYGQQFKAPFEGKKTYTTKLKSVIKSGIDILLSLKIFSNKNERKIISNTYFSFNKELEKIGYKVFKPFWSMGVTRSKLTDSNSIYISSLIKNKLEMENFSYLISNNFLEIIENYKMHLEKYFINNNICALFTPYDMPFFERIAFKCTKKIGIPSFIFAHGLPGRYNNIDDNRSDYLIVWGEKTKENYISTGVDKNKIYVSGHPNYKGFNKKSALKFNLENVLIITKSMAGANLSTGHEILSCRGNLILYLYSIQKVLKKIGVRNVRFRPHPSENGSWYLKYLDKDFYILDRSNLHDSIRKSSLIIGPSSTFFLDSIFGGVNYLVYEPVKKDGLDLLNYGLVDPFDGSNPKIPVAKNEGNLLSMINEKSCVDPSSFEEYVKTDFSIEFIKKMVK